MRFFLGTIVAATVVVAVVVGVQYTNQRSFTGAVGDSCDEDEDCGPPGPCIDGFLIVNFCDIPDANGDTFSGFPFTCRQEPSACESACDIVDGELRDRANCPACTQSTWEDPDGNGVFCEGALECGADMPAGRCVSSNWLDFGHCPVCCCTSCGDGVLQEELEECDDGNTEDGDGCSAECQIIPTVCGNNQVDPGEECDLGASGGETPTQCCTAACVFAPCSDGVDNDGDGVSDEEDPGCHAGDCADCDVMDTEYLPCNDEPNVCLMPTLLE